MLVKYEVDPAGDMLLVLADANSPFAPWDSIHDWPIGVESIGPPQAHQSSTLPVTTPPSESATKVTNDQPSVECSVPKYMSPLPWAYSMKADAARYGKQYAKEKYQPTFRVSSKQMMMASKYFKALLTGPWKDSNVYTAGLLTVTINGWDEEAILILLQAIHGKNSKVPQHPTLETLAKMAVVADYYLLHEFLAFHVMVWSRDCKLRHDTYSASMRECVLELLVFSFLENKEALHLTKNCMTRNARGPVPTLGLPGIQQYIDEVEERRSEFHDATVPHHQRRTQSINAFHPNGMPPSVAWFFHLD